MEEVPGNGAPNVEMTSTAAVARPKVRRRSGAAVGKQASFALVLGVAAAEAPDW